MSNDITLRRGQNGAGAAGGNLDLLTGKLGDKRQWESDSKLESAQKQIINLQNHSYYLERQLDRLVTMNPELQDELDKRMADRDIPNLSAEMRAEKAQLAEQLNNSTLIQSYEQIMQQYELELEKKSKALETMEAEQQQILQENSDLSHQMLVLKTKFKDDGKGQGSNAVVGPSDEEQIDKINKDQMVLLLKRNHDLAVEKNELYRAQNQQLEKVALEKDRLYNEVNSEQNRLQNEISRFQRQCEELKSQCELLDAKLKKSEESNKTKDHELKTLRTQKNKFEGQAKVHSEQLEVIQNSHDDLALKKSNEIDLLSREISQLTLKEKDVRQKLQWAEAELVETKDQLRSVTTELDTRTQENDHLVSILEDQEQKMTLYEQREKSIQNLATESKRRIEDANLERDRIQLKEGQYLRQIERLEETLATESKDRKQRHDQLIEALREKQRAILDSRDDEITELKIKLQVALDQLEKQKVECESLQKQHDKMIDSVRNFTEEANHKYEQYSKQINQAEMKNEEQNRALINEAEKQREEVEQMRNERKTSKIEIHELSVKLDGYKRDYHQYFDENKRLREHVNTVRDEKDTAISELKRLKAIHHNRVTELTDECNIKIAHLENQLLETKEKNRHSEEGAYEVMVQQEKIVDKWKKEHKQTVDFFEKSLKHLEVENRMLKDKVIQLKSTVSVLREEKLTGKAAAGPEGHDKSLRADRSATRGASSKSRDRDRSRGAK